MSLPQSFETPEQYFEASIKFFNKYNHWITTLNTHVLVEKTLDFISDSVVENIDVYTDFKITDLADDYLTKFLTDLKRLSVTYNDVDDGDLSVDFDAPVSVKKKYEVVQLVKEVKQLCSDNGCDTVIDLGSGLGYLDQKFHEDTGYNVLGIECDVGHHSRAVIRQKKYHVDSLQTVVYVQYRIHDNSSDDIEEFLHEYFKNHTCVCVTGLHSCGDLSIDGINLFLRMDSVKTLILMPCCYHRMSHNGDRFRNFPLSTALKDVSERHEGYGVMQVPFMRLAAHPTRNDQDLGSMVFSLLARAVLEKYARLVKCKLKRTKRKAVKKCDSFEDYIQEAATTGYKLIPESTETIDIPTDNSNEIINGFDMGQLRHIWAGLTAATFKKAAVYIRIQNLLQPVVENLVLYDRLVYLHGHGVTGVHRKVFREDQSPRCIALTAVKLG